MISQTDILNAKILIVDDMQPNVRVLERMLSGAGYTSVASTLDPHAVCELYRKNRYDLVVLDLLMPGMDGFQVIEGLKGIETNGYLPILVITAQPEQKLRALQAGAKDFISKPIDLIEVKTRMYNMLEVRLLYKQLESHNRLLEQAVLARTAELRKSEERFQRLTELSSDWYWEQDVNGLFTQLSGPALEMLGIRGAESKADETHVPGPRWNEAERAILEENIAARRPFLDLVCGRTNVDGSRQFFQVSGEPIFDPAGCYAGFRGIGMDVTELVRSGSKLPGP